jgi:flavin reductase (DIM6/NTAB) family NADH-FMN oxidoreductase RutF
MNENAKKTLLRSIPHGVYVVTTGSGDAAHGFTATWLTQGSFAPPLVVLSVRRDSHAYAAITTNKSFVVNFVPKDGRSLAEAFFKPPRASGSKLGDFTFQPAPVSGGPVLDAALGFVDCKFVSAVDHGDHAVVVGEVAEAAILRAGDALLLSDTPWKYGG